MIESTVLACIWAIIGMIAGFYIGHLRANKYWREELANREHAGYDHRTGIWHLYEMRENQ